MVTTFDNTASTPATAGVRGHFRTKPESVSTLTKSLTRFVNWVCCITDIDEEALDYADKMMMNDDDIAEEQLVDPVYALVANNLMMRMEGIEGLGEEEVLLHTSCVGVAKGVCNICALTTEPRVVEVLDGMIETFKQLEVSQSPEVAKTVCSEKATEDVDGRVFRMKDGPWTTESNKAKQVQLGSTRVKVDNTKLIGNRGNYTRTVVHECKNRFGRPERTAANVLAVRRYALDIMTRHGLRPTHVQQQLPMVVELVFVRSAAEAEAEHLTEALRYADAHRNGFNWFRRTYHFFVGVSPTRKWY